MPSRRAFLKQTGVAVSGVAAGAARLDRELRCLPAGCRAGRRPQDWPAGPRCFRFRISAAVGLSMHAASFEWFPTRSSWAFQLIRDFQSARHCR